MKPSKYTLEADRSFCKTITEMSEERRYAPDGGYYTYQEFYDYYGGEDEWYQAAPLQENLGSLPGGGTMSADLAEGFDGEGHSQKTNEGNVKGESNESDSEEDDDDDYSDDSQYVDPSAPPDEPDEEEEIVDWFAELEEEDQDELTEWYDDFLVMFEVYVVLDEIAWEVAMYDPTKDPIWLDEQVALGLWPRQSITYKQKWALGDFFKAMGGAYVDEDGNEINLWRRYRGWIHFDSDPFLTSWFGVKIDDITMKVKGIILSNNGLKGTIPLSISKLHGLTTLTLNRNGLEGEFPEAILGLHSLRSLDLHGNNFEGDIPENISQLNMLSFLYIHENKFSGRIDDLFTLRRLKYLNASTNEFSWGIPDTIRKTKQLEKLVLSGNQLMGSIPEEIGVCRNLRELYLDDNQLTGVLPDVLTKKLKKLEVLHLDSNEFEGSIPQNIGNLFRLKRLWMSNNRFRGHLPVSLGRLTRLTTLSLQHNNFIGFIPPFFGDLTCLETLRMDHNDFIGEVPRTLCSLVNLQEGQLSLGEGGFGDNQKIENFPVTLDTLQHWRTTDVPEREAEMTTEEFVALSKKKVWELKETLSEAGNATWAHKNKRAARWQDMKKRASRFDNRPDDVKKADYLRPAPGTGPSAEEIESAKREAQAKKSAEQLEHMVIAEDVDGDANDTEEDDVKNGNIDNDEKSTSVNIEVGKNADKDAKMVVGTSRSQEMK